jgi:hypothetical protein
MPFGLRNAHAALIGESAGVQDGNHFNGEELTPTFTGISFSSG